MNPLVIANAAKKTGKGIKEFANTKAGKQSVNVFGALIAGGLLYFGVKKYVQRSRYNKWQGDFGTDSQNGKAANYAARLHESFFPSGIEWFGHFDSTDEEAAYRVAKEMGTNKVSFALVAQAYKGLYERDLLKDITSEFSATEMQIFESYLGQSKTTTTNTSVSKIADSKAEIYHVIIDSWDGETLYKNVSNTYNPFTEYGRDSIVKVPRNTHVGRWTGATHKTFIQVEHTIGGNIYRYWIDKEEVKLVTASAYEGMKNTLNPLHEYHRREIVTNA